MPMRNLVAVALLLPLLLPAAASARKLKLFQYSMTSSAAGETTASFGSISNITNFGGPGHYSLSLGDRDDLVGCVAVASPTAGSIGFLAMEVGDQLPVINVTTFNHVGDVAPMAFSIMVHCPKP